jgi:uncharacterized protein (TIGR00369 family)
MAMSSWAEDYAALRARVKGPGQIDPARAATMSGLEMLQAIAGGTAPYPPINDTLDFFLLEVEKGRAVFQGQPGRQHYNPIGTVHGGFHATLLDSAMACAVHSLLEPGQAYTTLEFKINLVRPLTDRTGPVRAEGKVVSSGRRVATSEGRLVDEQGRLYSHGTTTCMIVAHEAARG